VTRPLGAHLSPREPVASIPAPPRWPRAASSRPTTSLIPRAQSTFRQRVPFQPPRLSPGHLHGPPPVPRLGRRWPGFRHAFTPPSQDALDPVVAGYSPRPTGPRDARQLLQRSAPRAPQRAPRLPADRRQAAHPPGERPSCEGRPTELPQVRGRWALRARRPPPRRPLASADLPQPDRPEHPCREHVSSPG
jgi:hypothetical protein